MIAAWLRAWLCILGLVMLTGCQPSKSADAHIAVASNFKPAMTALETAFEERTGHELAVSYGSTGQLYAQIKQGAPFDVFLAADQSRPARLSSQDQARVFPYAIGKILLWSPTTEAPLERLRSGEYSFLAMANPELAPYGVAAREVLDNLGLLDASRSKHVLGENIGQAFIFTQTGHADLGFIAYSQYLQLTGDKGWAWHPPEGAHAPIRQDGVILPSGRDKPAAQDFVDFLSTPKAASILLKYGYTPPDDF